MKYRLPWFAVIVLIGTALAAPPVLAGQRSAADCTFILGFKTLKGLIAAAEGPATVGECVENQRFDAHGNAEQRTAGGIMVWRKAGNWTAFSDGYRTWVNQGEDGLAVHINGAAAMIAGPDGTAMGTVTLTQGPFGVLIAADLMGLAPGGHGFHVHEVGTCTPSFAAAGGHFNPGGTGHGFLDEGGVHAGDTPNVYAAADGTVRADIFTAAVTLETGVAHSIFDADGSAIIVHEKPDTYGADPGAGARVACGVIQRNAIG